MGGTEELVRKAKDLLSGLEKYKFVLLILLAGVLLLLLSGREKQEPTIEGGTDPPELAFDLEALETKISKALSEIDGAGKTTVVLTLKGSTRQVLAQDIQSSAAGDKREERKSTVVVSQGTGRQGTVPLQQIYPQYQGALVVCPGGGDPEIRFKLMEAVSALTGLGSDKISICRGT